MSLRALWPSIGALVFLVIAACGRDGEGANDTIQIVASTSIVGALVAEVAGEHAGMK